MAMGIMEVLAAEVDGQWETLRQFARTSLPRAAKGAIFVGAGDSYAAALAGFYASGGRCIALDPYSLAVMPEIARGLEVYFISVSGRTASNVLAARRVRDVASGTTALTAVEKSRLAGLTENVVRLPMAYVPRMPGMLSFTLSLLAVIEIAAGRGSCDFKRALENAARDCEGMPLGRGTTYFLGNSLAYPAALYAAAKAYELLGAKAHAELLEEFSHLELFSLRKSDVVNIFSGHDQSEMAGKLVGALGDQGYESFVVRSEGASEAERLFHAVFAAQLWVLEKAREAGLTRPKFLSGTGRLRVSDAMIY
jgi:fructoselysine-6-P-deglycase FrlB-like protein